MFFATHVSRHPLAFGHLLLPAALWGMLLLLMSGCGQDQQAINDPKWLPQAMGRAVGESFDVTYDDVDALRVLNALGYAKISTGHYERRVDLTTQLSLVPSQMPSLPGIDAIAVISIYRPFLGEQQYLYDTLRSLLDELPEEAQINVLVGSADVAYVQHDTLAQQIGAARLPRVHVHAASKAIAQFFVEEPIGISTRATWNFARALRSYRGTSHLMLLEDDISLARGSMAQLRPYLDAPQMPVLALFNDRCTSVPISHQLPGTQVALSAKAMRANNDFPTTQAMVFASGVANSAGRFIATRAGRESYDYMLGRFFAQTQSHLGYVMPSIVQHEGRRSMGLSGPNNVPYSSCYVDRFVPSEADAAVD